MEVCRWGHPGTHGINLATGGARAIHRKRAPHVRMNTQDCSVYQWGDTAVCLRWIQHPLDSGRRGEVVWWQAEAVLYRGGPPGASKAASHTQPVGTTRQGYTKCQQHHEQVDLPRVNAIWCTFPCILQVIWESESVKVPVQIYNIYVTDAYHCSTLRPSQVGAFSYAITSTVENCCIIICIGLLFLMGLVNAPNYFCTF